jgi:hypothetical protein
LEPGFDIQAELLVVSTFKSNLIVPWNLSNIRLNCKILFKGMNFTDFSIIDFSFWNDILSCILGYQRIDMVYQFFDSHHFEKILVCPFLSVFFCKCYIFNIVLGSYTLGATFLWGKKIKD